MKKGACFSILTLLSLPLISISCHTFEAARLSSPKSDVSTVADDVTIVSPSGATTAERLAAKEIRRYLYLRTGELLPIIQSRNKLPSKTSLIVIGQTDRPAVKTLIAKNTALASSVNSLEPQQYLLKTIAFGDHQAVLIAGGNPIGTLCAAYRFAEHLGVRFYMHGDTIPDKRIALKTPKLDEKGKPLFNLRGIQPFHDFPEGPDWWNTDDYKAVIAQLPKKRMNFFGLHTYPQGGVGPEPTVWIGMPGDFNNDGTLKFSYPSRHFATPNTRFLGLSAGIVNKEILK